MPLPEKALIRWIRQQAGREQANRLPRASGIGDDCAVLHVPRGHQILVTTDFSLEGIHFNRKWQPAGSIGHRCLLRGLSDIAAMGGDPVAVFLSLGLPAKIPQPWVNEFLTGLLTLARKCGVPLKGGDTACSSGKILADIVVVGSIPKGKAILRSGARVGDRIFVTGKLGGAATTLSMLIKNAGKKVSASHFHGYFYPIPRLEVGQALRKKGIATSMIDISDGLSSDLTHICEESGVGAEIAAEAIPMSRTGKSGAEVDLQYALHGGEDYELLFTVSRNKTVPPSISGVPLTEIGRITRGREVSLQSKGKVQKLPAMGWEHFRKS